MQFRDLNKQYFMLKEKIDKGIEEVLNSSRFIGGAKVQELEEHLANYVGTKHCITCGNGTDAITLAMMTWKIGQGDAVFVPDFTFFSSGECPALLGATPFFVDVDRRTYNIDPIKLEETINEVINNTNLRPRAVVAVDLFGLPADYEKIKRICKKHNLFLLEDGAQGFGGSIKGKKACSFGDISTTSFFPAKPLGCYGDGGALFTDNDEWAAYLRSIVVHGKSGEDKYNNIRIGMNSRLDALQAAVLIPKLEAFDKYELEEINKVGKWYYNRLNNTTIELPYVPDGYVSSWAQYTVQLPDEVNRMELQKNLKNYNIPTMVYYMRPMHMQGAFKNTESSAVECPVTESLCKTVLSLPIHPYMTETEVDLVVEKLIEYVR